MTKEANIVGTDYSVSRRGRRYQLMLPLRVLIRKYCGPGLAPARGFSETTTENISSTGCYFLLDGEAEVRDQVEMEVLIKRHRESIADSRAVCRGRVVRVEKNRTQGKVGVACTIDYYRMTASGN
jgi:hypothetical protein